MKEKDFNEIKMKKALMKRALGYDAKEVIEEYVKGEDGIVLTKKKVTKKNVPPDISALKTLLELNPVDITSMSEEELIKEKERLLNELCIMQKKEEENCKKAKSQKKTEKGSTKK